MAHLAGVLPPGVDADLPAELRRRLHAAAEDGRDPMPADHVERQLREAWGPRSAGALDELDLEPVAVRPGGQVHRGVHEGQAVAVKLRRPGLAPVVRGDLVLVEQAVRVVAGAGAGLDVAGLVGELRERVLDELDLEHEASVQRSFARALGSSPRFRVGRPLSALCGETALVSPWVEGTPLIRLAHVAAPERLAAARALVAFHVGAARFGTVHADPDPRDALLTPDGRLAILDFGAVAPVPAGRLALVLAALGALADRDAAALARALDALGWLPGATAGDGAALVALAEWALGPFLEGVALLDADAVGDVLDRAREAAPQALGVLQRVRVQARDLWPLRGLGQLALALAPLGVEADWVALGRGAMAEGWG